MVRVRARRNLGWKVTIVYNRYVTIMLATIVLYIVRHQRRMSVLGISAVIQLPTHTHTHELYTYRV